MLPTITICGQLPSATQLQIKTLRPKWRSVNYEYHLCLAYGKPITLALKDLWPLNVSVFSKYPSLSDFGVC